MKEFYSGYQDPDKFMDNHDLSRYHAMELYKRKTGEYMSEKESEKFDEKLTVLKEDHEKDCLLKTETARAKNNAEHDVALQHYRNEMAENQGYLGFDFEKKHAAKSEAAINKYTEKSVKNYPSYQLNLEHLKEAIEEVRRLMADDRHWYKRLYRGFGLNIFSKQTPVVVPKNLFKEE